MTITTADVRAFTARRHAAGASNATINRDLMLLKRMCVLAMQAGTLTVRPYIPLLKERNIRQDFFEPEQFHSVKHHLPAQMRGIVEFAYVTGWRTPSEILTLEWRQVDLKAGEVRLDAGTTKNGEGRVFPFTTALRRVLEAQHQVADTLKHEQDTIARYVFWYTTGTKAGQRITESGFNKAWRKARIAAGCPGRIPHDFRRTAVRNLVRAGVPERVAMQLTASNSSQRRFFCLAFVASGSKPRSSLTSRATEQATGREACGAPRNVVENVSSSDSNDARLIIPRS